MGETQRYQADGVPTSGYRIAHLSDIHFGKIAHPEIVERIVADINTADVHLVALSGDLTQRARTHQFEAALKMIEAFEAPVLVVPGNHDVPAWWHNPIERVFHSASKFGRLIEDEETPSFVLPGLAAFGLNSAHGLTIKGGKIRRRHLAEMEKFFTEQPDGAFRVLVVHHHLLRLTALGRHDVARGAERAMEAAAGCGVNVILCGHLHQSHVENVEIVPPGVADAAGHNLVIASAGTATSSRGRGSNREVNFYNRITVHPGEFEIEEWRFDPATLRFESERSSKFAI